ncbi:MAG: hypothetical protein ACLP9Y_29910 [Mycobacterium sp.]
MAVEQFPVPATERAVEVRRVHDDDASEGEPFWRHVDSVALRPDQFTFSIWKT